MIEMTEPATTSALILPPPSPTPVPLAVPEAIVPDNFVHLHSHSHYSLLDGVSSPSVLIRQAGNLGQTAMAITDHGRVSGVFSFWEAADWYNKAHAERHSLESCQKNREKNDKISLACHSMLECRDLALCPSKERPLHEEAHNKLPPIRPIVGIETYVTTDRFYKKEVDGIKPDRGGHLVLLAKNLEGWNNIRYLSSYGSTEGFYYNPRVDWDLMEKYHEGIIVLSACLGGDLCDVWRAQGEEAADALIRRYQKLFGAENYYLELQWHNDQDLGGEPRLHEQHDLNRYLIGASARTGAKLVMTNDLHYSDKSKAVLDEIAFATRAKSTIEVEAAKHARGEKNLWFDTSDFWVKPRKEMQAALSNWLAQATIHDPEVATIIRAHGREWLNQTSLIAEQVYIKELYEKGKLHFPLFPLPERVVDYSIENEEQRNRKGAEVLLAEHVWVGAAERYPQMNEMTRRLVDYELKAICQMDFAPYFLITEDICAYARAQGVVNTDPIIDTNMGRGSAAGSIITYVLKITHACPIRYGLSDNGLGFTRFLNPIVRQFVNLDTFGELDPAFMPAQLAALSNEEMKEEIRLELNARSTERGNTLRAGVARDLVTGAEYSPERLEMEQHRWREHKTILLREWEHIKEVSFYEKGGSKSQAEFEGEGLAFPVELFWRWIRAIKAGQTPGSRNLLQSYLAPFLGLCTEQPTGMILYQDKHGKEYSDLPFLPNYRFEQARIGMPDIDLDFTPGPDGREKLMRYVTEKYGADHVTQISTFGTMQAKSAIKDTARAKGLSTVESDALSMLIPKMPTSDEEGSEEKEQEGILFEMIHSTNKEVMAVAKPLRDAMAADPKVAEIMTIAANLEGCKRTVSTHACGVLITDRPVLEYVAIERTPGESSTGSQASFDGPTLTDKLGLLKFDFLGVKNLKINRICVELIKERRGIDIDWYTLPDSDPAAMRLMGEGRTLGLFQMAAMATGILRQMKPKTVEDVAVVTALGRPGPMENVPAYLKARASGKAVYEEPIFAKFAANILDNTFGFLVFQEQMMRLSINVAGFSLTDSDGLRKATGKKDKEKMQSFKDRFVVGGTAKGIDHDWLEDWWTNVLEKFASYAFNLAHALCYSLLATIQAYLKAHYYPEFMAALLTVDQTEGKKKGRNAIAPIALEILESRFGKLGILPIDINYSTGRVEIIDTPLTPDDDPEKYFVENGKRVSLRMSFPMINGVKENPVNYIMADRAKSGPYASFADFMERTIGARGKTDADGVRIAMPLDSKIIKNLVSVGAFDAFDDRASLLARLEEYFGSTSARKKALVDWSPTPGYDPATAFKPQSYFGWEYELIGAYVSGHPADDIKDNEVEAFAAEAMIHETAYRYSRKSQLPRVMSRHFVSDIIDIDEGRDEQIRLVPGVLKGVIWKTNRSGVGGRYEGKIEDATGSAGFVYWKPKDDATTAQNIAFRDFEETVLAGRINNIGVAVVGQFSYKPQYNKEGPIISIFDWKEMALPTRAAAPINVTPTAVDDRATKEALLFGGVPVSNGGSKPAAKTEASAPLAEVASLPTKIDLNQDLFDI